MQGLPQAQGRTVALSHEVQFIKRFAQRLHQAGVPAHQLEGMVGTLARWLGYRSDIWTSPTAIFISLRASSEEEETGQIPMQLIRLQPGTTNLADTAELYGMGEALILGRMSLEEAYLELKRPREPWIYPAWSRILSGGLVSGTFALMLTSGWLGALTATVAGILVGVLYMNSGKAVRAGGMEAIAATVVSLLVYGVHSQFAGIEPSGIIMAGLILLMPGLALTTAVTELSTENLTSGSARLAGALVVLLKLSLGALLGSVIADWLSWDAGGSLALGASHPPSWVQWPALLVSAACFAVLFNVRVQDFHIAVVAAVTGYLVSRVGVMLAGIEFGVMLAALVIALLGNLLGRALRLPASLVRVPGIILLVPGSLGYRSVSNVILHGSPSSQETAMLVATMVIALVGGLLIGNTIVPPRRHL